MTDSNAIAYPLSPSATGGELAALDPNASHHLSFARQRWFAGLSTVIQASLMLGVGAFLLLQIPETPRLVRQLTMVGSLLMAGGALVGSWAIRDLLGYLRIDPQGFACRTGLRRYAARWSDVTGWRVNELAKTPEIACVLLTADEPPRTCAVPGGVFDRVELGRIRHLLGTHAAGKEGRN